MPPSPRRLEKGRDEGFTRGEKCLYTHLVVTFVLILLVVVVYFCHLCVVRHGAGDAFRVTRLSAVDDGAMDSVSGLVSGAGVVLLLRGVEPAKGARVVCGCIALRSRWSAVPALCAAARTEPALAQHLPFWAVRYRSDNGSQQTGIARSIVHSHFVRDDLQNNIGLFEHSLPIHVDDYHFIDVAVDDEFLYQYASSLSFSAWGENAASKPEGWTLPATPVAWQTCRAYMSPVAELRYYEVCARISAQNTASLPPIGAALATSTKVLGFFSWGDKHGRLPMVILNLDHFRDWIGEIISE